MSRLDPQLSHIVCWTRMQAEAGQSIETIVARKELERRAGGACFAGVLAALPRVASASSRVSAAKSTWCSP